MHLYEQGTGQFRSEVKNVGGGKKVAAIQKSNASDKEIISDR